MNTFQHKTLAVAVDNHHISQATASLLNMGASVLGVERQKHSVSRSNLIVTLSIYDDVKADIVRRKLEFKYGLAVDKQDSRR